MRVNVLFLKILSFLVLIIFNFYYFYFNYILILKFSYFIVDVN